MNMSGYCFSQDFCLSKSNNSFISDLLILSHFKHTEQYEVYIFTIISIYSCITLLPKGRAEGTVSIQVRVGGDVWEDEGEGAGNEFITPCYREINHQYPLCYH